MGYSYYQVTDLELLDNFRDGIRSYYQVTDLELLDNFRDFVLELLFIGLEGQLTGIENKLGDEHGRQLRYFLFIF